MGDHPSRTGRDAGGWLALLTVAAACGGPPAPDIPAHLTGQRVAVVGWDGADWEIARPLMAAGRMPHLRSLVDRGASARLRSLVPTLSPLLWTSIATGRPPEVHGVLDFLEPDPTGGPPRPVRAEARVVPALWEMAAAAGLRAGVVGWWATHPAAELPGFVVSDRFAYTLLDAASDLPRGTVAPRAAEPAVLARRLRPADVPAAELSRLVGPGAAAPEADASLARIVAATLSYHAALLELLGDGQPDLLLAYFQGIDQVSHRFMDCEAPALPFCPEPERSRFGGTVRGFYELQDRLLGELLDALDPGTTVLVVSDHGFLQGAARPRYTPPDIHGEPGRWHRRDGIFAVAGPEIEPGDLGTIDLLQVTPTVLRLLGLPVGADMEGEPVEEALSAGFRTRFPQSSIDSWAEAVERTAASGSGEELDEAERRQLEELTALGYVSTSSGRTAAGGRSVAAEVNLASRLLQGERLEEAAAALDRALRRSPEYAPAWAAMAEVRHAQGRVVESVECRARAVVLAGPQADPSTLLRWAVATGEAGVDPDALEVLARATRARPGSADLAAARGVVLASSGDLQGAIGWFWRTLDIDPTQHEALGGLFAAAGSGAADPAGLEVALRRAVERDPDLPMPRNWLALTLARGGDAAGGERILRDAAERFPQHAGTRINLGGLMGRAGRPEEAVVEFRRARSLAPEAVEAWVGLGAALARLGRLEEAKHVLEEPDAPRDPRLLNTLALVYRDLGMPDRAAGALRASLRLRPDQPAAKGLLGELEGGG